MHKPPGKVVVQVVHEQICIFRWTTRSDFAEKLRRPTTVNIGSREEGRGDKEEGSDVGKEEDSIHESFLRPPESTLRPIYLRTIERKEGGQTDGQTERRQERRSLRL